MMRPRYDVDLPRRPSIERRRSMTATQAALRTWIDEGMRRGLRQSDLARLFGRSSGRISELARSVTRCRKRFGQHVRFTMAALSDSAWRPPAGFWWRCAEYPRLRHWNTGRWIAGDDPAQAVGDAARLMYRPESGHTWPRVIELMDSSGAEHRYRVELREQPVFTARPIERRL